MRPGLALTGLLLAAAGGAALAVGLGAFGPSAAERRLADAQTSRFIADHPAWWPVAAGVAVALALAGLYWLAVLGRTALRRRRARVDGATRLQARAAGGDLAADMLRIPGVLQVHTRFVGTPSRPRLAVTLRCAPDADLAELQAWLAGEPLRRFRAAMQMPQLTTIVRFRLDRRERRDDAAG